MADKSLDFKLHPSQSRVWADPSRFRIVVAGRRWGKSRLAAMELLKAGLEGKKDAFYVAPTFQQARDIMWDMLIDLGKPVIKNIKSQEGCLELVNGRKLYIKGSDRPDTMRGVGLSFVVIDEYADMKPMVWEQILRPALADVVGKALFIGTPKGRNHFFDLVEKAAKDESGVWSSYHFTSKDNPFLPVEEIEAARLEMSSMNFKQEFEASFQTGSSDLFSDEWLQYVDKEPNWPDSEWFTAVDLAGFEQVRVAQDRRTKRLDLTSIATVKVSKQGWYVKRIRAGRWDVRETALRILRDSQTCGSRMVGIEKGALHKAVQPYLEDTMRRLNFYPRIETVTHGNQNKIQRVVWALQGRFEHGKIYLQRDEEWNKAFEDEYKNFPSSQVHDDMIDSLSYVDQLATTLYWDVSDFEQPEYVPMDSTIGY